MNTSPGNLSYKEDERWTQRLCDLKFFSCSTSTNRQAAARFLDDKQIDPQLNAPITDVERQLSILEDNELVMLAKAFGPSYGARLTPKGMQALEGANSQPASARRIGF